MKKILFVFAVVAGIFTGVVHADNNCTGATYYDANTDACIACPTGYDYNTDAGKDDITDCQMHCDAGTFAPGYTQLEYIESTGTQYIDTRQNFMYGDEFFFDYMPIANYSDENKGYGSGGGSTSEISGGGRRVNGDIVMYIIGSNISYSPTLSYNDSLLHRYTEHWTIKNGVFSSTLTDVSSGTIYSLSKNDISDSYNSSSMVYLFRANAGSHAAPSHSRIYGTWLKRANGNYAFNFIPARRNSDDVVGMYDTVTGTFFMNSGTGEFIAGSDVEQCVNVGAGYYAGASTVNFGSVGTRTACPMGTSTNGATNASECTPCAGATYGDETGMVACKTCPAGYDYNTTAGKTDITDCQTHCDAGTYVETVGNEIPDDYTELEYIESTGTQYIDTRQNFMYGDEFFFDYMPIANYSDENKGYGSGGGSTSEISGGGRRVNGDIVMYIIGSNISYSPTLSYNDSLLHRYTEHWTIKNGVFSSTLTDVSSGTIYSLSKNDISDSYNSSSMVYLFRANAGSHAAPSHSRIYGTWLKRANGNYAFNFIPARRNSDDVVGMYDTVTGTFFMNSGTGEFIAGSDVEQCVNVGAGYYAGASTVNFGSVGTRTACPAGTTTVGYGHSADMANDCGRTLHVGDGVLYMKKNKETSPAVGVDMGGGDVYYISLTPTNHSISTVHFWYNGAEYTAYDDSLFYGERDFDTGQQISQ